MINSCGLNITDFWRNRAFRTNVDLEIRPSYHTYVRPFPSIPLRRHRQGSVDACAVYLRLKKCRLFTRVPRLFSPANQKSARINRADSINQSSNNISIVRVSSISDLQQDQLAGVVPTTSHEAYSITRKRRGQGDSMSRTLDRYGVQIGTGSR